MNSFIADLPTFSVKIMENNESTGIQVGVAVDSNHYTLILHENSWCYDTYGCLYDHSALTHTGVKTPTNSIVTVSVNLENKTISYKIDSNPVGTPQSVNLIDAEFKPVLMSKEGESVEIYP